MRLIDVAMTSAEVGRSASRRAKTALIFDLLSRAKTDPELVVIIVSRLAGELPQRQIGAGWAALRSLPPAAAQPTLTIVAVDATFSAIGAVSGKGSLTRRAELAAGLFASASESEQTFLRRPLAGELRQGALAGAMADAVAAGHEGVMAKSRGAPYEAGPRGAGWLKVKPVHTLDLVVLAVE